MNKKLLFAAMSLLAFTACTDNDFESQKSVAEEVGSVQFEILNNDDAFTRASMNGNTITFSANDGDLFTLYHGAALGALTGYENATYSAKANEGEPATLTTPSVIKQGGAVMVWPVDTTFRIKPADALTLTIPIVLEAKDEDHPNDGVENHIPYVSDLIDIEAWAAYSETAPAGVIPTAYKTAGKDRKYQVYMRPMASQLNVKADYAGTDATLATLYTGDDPIDPIKVTSVDLLTTTGGGTTDFTFEIPVKFSAAPAGSQWGTVANNKWNQVTDFNIAGITAAGQTDKLTTKCLVGNEGCKFLILPQATIPAAGVDDGGLVVNTIYGKVVVANAADADNHGSQYLGTEIADAWYRFVTNPLAPGALVAGETAAAAAEASGEHAGKFKVTSEPKIGMEQTINVFSGYTATSGVATGEPVGAAATRYVKVLLSHLDMSGLHVKTDKQLRDAAKVWQKMGLPTVTVYLDGDATSKSFVMSQKTIETINAINAASGAKFFGVQPCAVAGEVCNRIVITGGDKIQDMTFILANGTQKAEVRLNGDTNWKWDGTVKIATTATTGISQIVNWGTLTNAADKVLNITEPNGTTVNDILFLNDGPGVWNITAGKVRVQNRVRNNGKLNISSGAQYLQDGALLGTTSLFTNNALALPTRFGGSGQIGKVENKGVFATISNAEINNYGLIEHADAAAKTYITRNQTASANFALPFAAGGNMMGRINLPYSNKDEDNISINSAANEGFVSVTVDGEVSGTLTNSAVGTYVNYIIVNSGVTEIANLATQVKYLEIADKTNKEIAWALPGVKTFTGLMVLSDINIKLGTTVNVSDATYLGKDMYVGGTFTTATWAGYFGNTAGNVATQYITY